MDYHKIVLIHRILVSLFLFHYVFKGYLLLVNKKDILANYTAKTRIAEMIVALCFMLTGFYFIIAGPGLSVLMWVKVAMVFASIPIAIIGFKRNIKPMAIVAILLLIGAYGIAEMDKKHYAKQDKAPIDTSTATDPVAEGKMIYISKCVACHGEAGDGGLGGAKNLKTTQLTDEQQKDIILHGKGGMSPFPSLTNDQLNGVVAYLKTLK